MQTIYKYQLPSGENRVKMPFGSAILYAGAQHDVVCVWALVDPGVLMEEFRYLWVFGTGHEIPDSLNLKHIGTAILDDGAIVYHVFEEI